MLESCKKAAGGGRCALPPKGNVIRQTTKNGFKGARSVCRRLSFSFPFLSWPCLVFAMALATHACGGETQAVRISRPVGLVCFECHVAIVFFAIYLEPWFFFFTLMRFHPNNFSEYFRQTTKNGSKGTFSVCRRVSFSFYSCPLRFWFAMALATHACDAEPKLFVFLEPWFFFFFADNNFSEFCKHTTQNGSKGFFRCCCKGVAQRFSHCAQHCQSALVAGRCLLFEGRNSRFTTCISAWCVAFCFRSERVSRLRDHPLNLTKSIQLLQQVPHVVSHCHSLSTAKSPGVRSMLLVLS